MSSATNESICPVCSHDRATDVVRRLAVPVHQNLLYPTLEAARSARRGDLDFRACDRCGFLFNSAFDPALMEYGPQYENSQQHSTAFVDHLDAMVDRIVRHHGRTDGTVVEVGCGKGDFLRRLLNHPASHAQGVGVDPSYLGPPVSEDGRARFLARFFDSSLDLEADVVVCRHVIEHLADPVGMMTTVRSAAVSDRTTVFFETPCADWILRNSVLWDLFYEHCSLFTAHSLGLALTRAGFRVTDVRHVFGGQYLWAEAVAALGEWPLEDPQLPRDPVGSLGDEPDRVGQWREQLSRLREGGPVVLWGAGAKGLTFCNLVDPHRTMIDRVIDVNPAKQDRFLGGSGHPISGPDAARGAATAVVLNPNYVEEIRRLLSTIDPEVRVVNWME
ncbi:class I SAM-dependent methyltransferase [Sporichthya polymorpha]|uniref:class I SAM-dependent methyltransferase n=1 Tax=Sporichthya polymorpha TaxID=35751 RepID=UPI000368A521|nr:class I SAM-dependent methyltransferase [Sporichthya polymorpha]